MEKDEITYKEGYTIRKIEYGIVEIIFHPQFFGDLEDVKLVVERLSQFRVNNTPILLLAVYAEDNTFSPEATKYISSAENNKIVKAEALVITGLATRIIGNFYLKINKPKRPSKLFTSRLAAIEWLLSLNL
ncbi:MAG: hypothetical protein IT238_10325 [Bacteroidia bacterium]|nr:hypothetical protein [Bacteroidia bacterium]MCZ2247985.1 hypothetical protein [Bacteroidia bacterium]